MGEHSLTLLRLAVLAACLAPSIAPAQIASSADPARIASFDILTARVTRTGNTLTFLMTTSGTARANIPASTGSLARAPVHAYVWPTSLDPAAVGFEGETGILALAATSHPEFDDTPLHDEDGDGDPENDGTVWHAHWVALAPSTECGPSGLAFRDIPEGQPPRMPATWPGLPLFIDSPTEKPVLDGSGIRITIDMEGAAGATCDGVTTALRVNADMHAPLLCVTEVFDIASGDLSMPGRID